MMANRHPTARIRSQRGAMFVLAAAAAIAAGVGIALAQAAIETRREKINQQKVTEYRSDKIDAALKLYSKRNGRLPCPADGSAALDSAAGSTELGRTTAGATDPICSSLTSGNSACTAQKICALPSGKTLDIAVLPWRTLGLQPEDALDPWGRRIVYRPYQGLTSNGQSSLVQDNGMRFKNCMREIGATTRTCVHPMADNSIISNWRAGTLTTNPDGTSIPSSLRVAANPASLPGDSGYHPQTSYPWLRSYFFFATFKDRGMGLARPPSERTTLPSGLTRAGSTPAVTNGVANGLLNVVTTIPTTITPNMWLNNMLVVPPLPSEASNWERNTARDYDPAMPGYGIAYVLISRGPNGGGGWLPNGRQFTAANGTMETRNMRGNTDSAGVTWFYNQPPKTDQSSNAFDDIVLARRYIDIADLPSSSYVATDWPNEPQPSGTLVGDSGGSVRMIDLNQDFNRFIAAGASANQISNIESTDPLTGKTIRVLNIGKNPALTTPQVGQAVALSNNAYGCVWVDTPLNFTQETIRAYWEMRIYKESDVQSGGSNNSADGGVFTVIPGNTNVTEGLPCGNSPTEGYGVNGSDLAYVGSRAPDLANTFPGPKYGVEFDIWDSEGYNKRNDPANNHMAVVRQNSVMHGSSWPCSSNPPTAGDSLYTASNSCTYDWAHVDWFPGSRPAWFDSGVTSYVANGSALATSLGSLSAINLKNPSCSSIGSTSGNIGCAVGDTATWLEDRAYTQQNTTPRPYGVRAELQRRCSAGCATCGVAGGLYTRVKTWVDCSSEACKDLDITDNSQFDALAGIKRLDYCMLDPGVDFRTGGPNNSSPNVAAPAIVGMSYPDLVNSIGGTAPVGYWRLNDANNASSVRDYSPTGNNAGLYNGIKPGSSQTPFTGQTSTRFDEDDDEYLGIAANNAYNLPRGTVHMWVKPDDDNDTMGLFVRDENGTSQDGHFMLRLKDGKLELRMQTMATGNNGRWVYGTTTLDTSRWYHVAATWGSGGMKLYLNGALEGSTPHFAGINGNSLPIVLGASSASNNNTLSGNKNDHFDGRLSEVALHGVELSAAQIATLANFNNNPNQTYTTSCSSTTGSTPTAPVTSSCGWSTCPFNDVLFTGLYTYPHGPLPNGYTTTLGLTAESGSGTSTRYRSSVTPSTVTGYGLQKVSGTETVLRPGYYVYPHGPLPNGYISTLQLTAVQGTGTNTLYVSNLEKGTVAGYGLVPAAPPNGIQSCSTSPVVAAAYNPFDTTQNPMLNIFDTVKLGFTMGTGGARAGMQITNMRITNGNRSPKFTIPTEYSNASAMPMFRSGGTAVIPAAAQSSPARAAVTVTDADMALLNGGLGDYNGAEITVRRAARITAQNGTPLPSIAETTPNVGDVYAFDFTNSPALSLSGGNIMKAGKIIAVVTNASGFLRVRFTKTDGLTPTTSDVNAVLQAISYRNTETAPPKGVVLRFALSDGVEGNDFIGTGRAELSVLIRSGAS